MLVNLEMKLETRGAGDIVDITPRLRELIRGSEIMSGSVIVFSPSATSGLTTLEYEPGLIKDLPQLLERLIPSDCPYHHDKTWQDGNGFSHLRAALIGPGITIPFVKGELSLGTWQQVVFLEFDNQARSRRLVVQISGEGKKD
ncbi:MAG: secondary thiamine-phosphate synthase enzyme YjbQ [candidate division Zixibacteria bacterium]|nr:secondary thiamine-phosphate synthase enzyme YjbQ [candidate division Zixibacteria bacterium]